MTAQSHRGEGWQWTVASAPPQFLLLPLIGSDAVTGDPASTDGGLSGFMSPEQTPAASLHPPLWLWLPVSVPRKEIQERKIICLPRPHLPEPEGRGPARSTLSLLKTVLMLSPLSCLSPSLHVCLCSSLSPSVSLSQSLCLHLSLCLCLSHRFSP